MAGAVLLAAVVLGAVLLARPGAAAAQGVTGVVRHGATAAPLPGVLVSVLDLDGERVRAVLTDEVGRFAMEVPMGRYRLRAERIGLRAETTDPFDLASLRLEPYDIDMVERAVPIVGLVVDSRVQSCRLDRDDAVRIQHWWGEVRTALDVSSVLQDQRFSDFRVERYEREWDEELERLSDVSASVVRSTSSRPFVSMDARALADRGFVQGDARSGRSYYAPDADVLLSSVFLADHCFSVQKDPGDQHWIGLRFEPTRDHDVTDIEGTLWVDTTTAELRRLDFSYTEVDDVPESRAGGMVGFDYLPTGAWIVSRWFIRMPRLGLRQRRRSEELVVLGYRDVGADVTALAMDAAADAAMTVGRVAGVVFDSIRGRGLAGATVSVLGTRFQATTDASGAFAIDGVPTGHQMIAYFHADTNAWGLGSPLAEVDVEEGRTAVAELAVPSFRQVATALCMGTGNLARTILVGYLTGPDDDGLGGIEMEFSWQARLAGDQTESKVLAATTGSDGRFLLCSLPVDTPVFARARVADRWRDLFEIRPTTAEIEFRVVRLLR